jgi:hypothetical protein
MDYFQRYMNYVKVNILVVAYRGYSKSTGVPSEQGIK